MGFGILEGRWRPQLRMLKLTSSDKKLEHVPGTVALDDREAEDLQGVSAGLKHAAGHDVHIVLSPQPSEDPNDPLNWSVLVPLPPARSPTNAPTGPNGRRK